MHGSRQNGVFKEHSWPQDHLSPLIIGMNNVFNGVGMADELNDNRVIRELENNQYHDVNTSCRHQRDVNKRSVDMGIKSRSDQVQIIHTSVEKTDV